MNKKQGPGIYLLLAAALFSLLIQVHKQAVKFDQVVKRKMEIIHSQTNEDYDKFAKYLNGIDFKKPVEIFHIKKGDVFIQYQIPGAPQGNFYGLKDSTPSELGISDVGYDPIKKKVVKKEKRTYTSIKNFDALSSYAAPVIDKWSTPEIETQTEGSKLQIFTTCKKCFEEF